MTKADYIALEYVAKETVWIKQFIKEMRLERAIESFTLHRDNKMTIALTKNVKS